ncbi:MFS transporter, partial [Staphylococcus aureus]
GVLFLPITVSVILGSLLYKRLSKKYNEIMILRVTITGFAIFTLLFGWLNESNVIILSVIIFILGTCVGIVPALLSTIISKRFERIKGKVLGVFNFVRYIRMTVGALLIGIISQPLVAFYFTTITIMLIIIFLYIKIGDFQLKYAK